MSEVGLQEILDDLFARSHESLEAMSIAKLDDIRSQSAADDWSAVICDQASINDLDGDAISRARQSFASLHAQRILEATINGWDDAAFLDKAKLTINGRITRTALILLGKNESAHHLNPDVAELTWKLEGPEQGYEHFQMARYLPLPDYDLSDSQHVALNIPGRFIDGNYSRILLTHSDLGLTEALALDAVQKHRPISDDMLRRLRQLGLVEGRRGRLHVARDVAASTDTVDEYVRHRAFDDRYYGDLIVEFLRTNGEARREDIDRLLKNKLSDLLDARQKRDKIRNLLQKLKRQKKIIADGNTRAAKWRLP